MSKPGPKEGLLPGQEDDINKMFYRDYMIDYFDIKITTLVDLLSNTKENIDKLSTQNYKLGKVEFKTLDSTDIDKLTSFAKSEIVSEYYHCLETFMRLFISHALFKPSPLIELTAMDNREYHKYLNQIARKDFEHLNDRLNGNETISLVIIGGRDYKESGLTEKQFNNLKEWISMCAQQLQSMSEYNSFKHGLSMFIGKSAITMTNPDNDETLLEKNGDSVYILESKDIGNRYEFNIKNIFVEYDYKTTLMMFYNEMIKNIITIGKWRYITKEKTKTIPGLHFAMFDYFELRDMFFEKENIGALMESYSIKLFYEEDLEELNMKNVIITGAANGVGKAVAQILKNENLILIDIDDKELEKTAKELNKDYYVCDLSDANQISEIISKVNKQYIKIDCLINCAGMWISGDMSKLQQPVFDEMNTLDRIKSVIDTNVFGTIAMIKSIFPIMKNQGYGQIININSQSGVMCEPSFPIYNATKHSTNAFRKAIQDDLARNNIKITDVCPGLICTDFYKRAKNPLPKEIMETGLTSEDVAKTVKYVFDLPREITIPSIEVRHIKNY